jgi:ABC-type multidrug transport system ATPase subunit
LPTILQLQNLGKRFNRHWIFRRITYEFISGQAYAIIGANGSGKSTLLQIIAGAMQQSEGAILVGQQPQPITENYYQQIAIAAPYIELVEELTLTEFLEFHFKLKPLIAGQTIASVITYIGLTYAANKQIRYYSSGMKQRVKLAQALFSNAPILLLDEPTTNLDVQGIALYHQLIKNFAANRLLIICSNDEAEIAICTNRLNVADFGC